MTSLFTRVCPFIVVIALSLYTNPNAFADTRGSECLYLALRVMKPAETPRSFKQFQQLLGKSPKGGYSLTELDALAQKNGLFTALLNGGSDQLETLTANRLAILHIAHDGDPGHFALCTTMNQQVASLFDPLGDLKNVSRARLGKLWTGKGLVLSDSPIDLRSGQSASRVPLYISLVTAIFIASALVFWRLRK
ncbi:Peptidase C39 family protein [Pirellula sp. SH-Sr6A]|uniref:cysteine peptidase family C39 domain-containing protein n=1 Tax=Pirellula sp. SH-Sr6A TaxID=1632865 RepID=UPI00078EED6E|nr:cysteine peptidase family C39 domain-containing protein [Pirellula sp. SH-Sr6A]AMV35599.1 Peptidase C39 family protein [Pirellula sp. SH-Sr6A]